MGDYGIIGGSVEGDEKSPTSPITVVFIAAMEEVAVEEKCIASF